MRMPVGCIGPVSMTMPHFSMNMFVSVNPFYGWRMGLEMMQIVMFMRMVMSDSRMDVGVGMSLNNN